MQQSVDLRRVIRQQLESLRLSGVEWVAWTGSTAGGKETVVGARVGIASSVEAPAAPDVDESTGNELEVLKATISACKRCPALAACRTQTVFGVGRVHPELCFVGEAPGADEDAQGEPFVGAAGQLLNRIIGACQMKREDVYICNIIKCRPPGNRTPLPDEIANCRAYLEKQLELVRPRFICALGSTAAHSLLGTTLSMAKLRGRFHDYKGIPVIVTYHPAYLLPHRAPHMKNEVWKDMKMLMARMGRPIG
jgi:uracil-DNA glycosylase family 4